MPCVEPRVNAKGKITSYRITISDGYKLDGSQNRHYFIWIPPRADMPVSQMEKEATAAAYKFEEKLQMGFKLDNRVTFAEYAAYVLELKEQSGISPTTLERYIAMLPVINEAIGNYQLVKLRPDVLNAFYGELLQTPRKDGVKAIARRSLMCVLDEIGISNSKLARETKLAGSTITNAVRGDPITLESAQQIAAYLEYDYEHLFKTKDGTTMLSPKTVLEHHRLISTILHQAEKEMLIEYNPAARATPPKARHPDPDYYQPEEMDEILDALENAPLKWKTITYIMIDSGCRRGEVMGLKWESLDLETGLMVIENNLLYTKSKGIYVGPTKTGKVRALKLAAPCIELLKKWKLEQTRLKLKCGPSWVDNGMVFTQDDGSFMHPDSVTDWLNKFSRENELPHIHPHAFRHTAASTMIANGVDLVTAANELGHANATTTANIHAHQIAIAQARAAEVRGGVFANRTSTNKGSKLRSKYRGG